ncbi:hypothetical protein K474DRAFT_1664404 [Panus rudis PR-1116 ss-1]|nr:hypothetical protein K474DRAFT_1664404 [Panus rudis PR-1116 ss-1]
MLLQLLVTALAALVGLPVSPPWQSILPGQRLHGHALASPPHQIFSSEFSLQCSHSTSIVPCFTICCTGPRSGLLTAAAAARSHRACLLPRPLGQPVLDKFPLGQTR